MYQQDHTDPHARARGAPRGRLLRARHPARWRRRLQGRLRPQALPRRDRRQHRAQGREHR